MLEYEEIIDLKKGKLHSASCPVFRIAHKSSLEALTDVITWTPSRLLWEASSHAATKCEDNWYKLPTSVYSESLIQLSEWKRPGGQNLSQGLMKQQDNSIPEILEGLKR